MTWPPPPSGPWLHNWVRPVALPSVVIWTWLNGFLEVVHDCSTAPTASPSLISWWDSWENVLANTCAFTWELKRTWNEEGFLWTECDHLPHHLWPTQYWYAQIVLMEGKDNTELFHAQFTILRPTLQPWWALQFLQCQPSSTIISFHYIYFHVKCVLLTNSATKVWSLSWCLLSVVRLLVQRQNYRFKLKLINEKQRGSKGIYVVTESQYSWPWKKHINHIKQSWEHCVMWLRLFCNCCSKIKNELSFKLKKCSEKF